MYIPRSISKILLRATEQFPVVFLTGPRQSGKTTLLKNQLGHFRYVNLEDPDMRQWALDQPRDFLQQNPAPLIIDEVQYAPALFSYIQLLADESQRPGMFVLSGSQNLLVMEGITQSLAGRSAILKLLPFAYHEIREHASGKSTNHLMLKGFYPRLFQTVSDSRLFYNSYLNTYVERDVRQLANIGQTIDFMRFTRLCAGRCGQLLNVSALATEAGIAYNTCKAWLSYLTTGYVLHMLQPHHKNFSKKTVKTPKLFFYDTGLLNALLGIDNEETLALHPLRGAVFENLVFSELIKYTMNNGLDHTLWFWRDNHGTEIDFLFERNNMITAIEVKSGMNIHPEYLNNLDRYSRYNPEVHKKLLIYDGDMERTFTGTILLNWRNTLSGLPGEDRI
ncbi:MAG: ATP-binding protein [Bacteroidales bacterium]|nr:ATP-binding protein [Bacteroidales bacterium]